jgi:hypothetical protein
MTSKKRIHANRRNARKSTGPKTPGGKAAVRLNSLWHGAFATDLLLPGEDAKIFAGHRDEFLTLYQPCSQAEEFLVNRMILSSWRLMRLVAMESRVLRAQTLRSSRDIDLLRCAKSLIRGADEHAEPDPEPVETGDPIALA